MNVLGVASLVIGMLLLVYLVVALLRAEEFWSTHELDPPSCCQATLLVAVLCAVHRPLGDYLARTVESPRHLRVERVGYRLFGVDPDADQRGRSTCARARLLAWCAIVLLYALLRLAGVPPVLAVA